MEDVTRLVLRLNGAVAAVSNVRRDLSVGGIEVSDDAIIRMLREADKRTGGPTFRPRVQGPKFTPPTQKTESSRSAPTWRSLIADALKEFGGPMRPLDLANKIKPKLTDRRSSMSLDKVRSKIASELGRLVKAEGDRQFSKRPDGRWALVHAPAGSRTP